MKYTDYDLMVLNRIKGAARICLIGEDILYFQELIGMVYPNTFVRSYGTPEILGSKKGYDYILIGDSIVKEALGKDYLYNFNDPGFLTGAGEPVEEKDTVVLGIVKELSLKSCCNVFIRCGLEILSAKKLRVMENSEEAAFLFELKEYRQELDARAKELASRYDSIYVLCPEAVKTGGVEDLHQLVYHINRLGGNAYITYLMTGDQELLTLPAFEKYVYGHVRTRSEIIDDPNNAVIIPEGWFVGVDFVSKAKRLFWWLSVDNYVAACENYGRSDSETEMLSICEKVDVHLCQSEYARDYVLKHDTKGKPVVRLSDYLDDVYIDNCEAALKEEKQDIVLYNPKKGREFTDRLIEAAPDITWKPIENMTTEQVQEALRAAKVYIDFGNHPGKDKIPREAAVSGCIVITGRRGSAGFKEDVYIPDEYRMDEETTDISGILDMIRSSLSEYQERIGAFEEYRQRILSGMEQFVSDIAEIFFSPV